MKMQCVLQPALSVSIEGTRQQVQDALATKEEVLIQQRQSQELVQIMLNASIGSLFYLRGFLPLSCFDTRCLDTKSESAVSYEEFLEHGSAPREVKVSQPLRVLLRHRHTTADAILDLLERGVFDALGKRVLEALQLTICRDKEKPSQVLETYTFTFLYNPSHDNGNGDLASVSLNSGGCTMQMGTIKSAKVGLEMIIRRLITLSAFLPSLPSKRFLHIHLFYTKTCPHDYEPPGFTSTTLENIYYPQIENWATKTQSCGVMNGPHHRIGLKVTSLQSCTGEDQIPESLEYSNETSREFDVGIAHDGELPDQVNTDSQAGWCVDSQEDLCHSTQTRKDLADRKMLQAMLEPSSVDTGLMPTQGLAGPPMIMATPAIKPQLSQQRISEIRKERNESPCNRLMHEKLDETRFDPENGVVNCQCGWKGAEKAMRQCRFCGTWQHLLCYGFGGPDDSRLPEAHACYNCLLSPNEKETLREMHTLVLLRRALILIREEGYPNRTKTFAEKLHCNGQAIVQVTDLLKKKGFLKSTPGYKSRGFAVKSLPNFVIPKDQEVVEQIDHEIFDPFSKISQHYFVPQTSARVTRSSSGEIHPVFGTYRARSRRRLWPLDEELYRTSEDCRSTASAASSENSKPKHTMGKQQPSRKASQLKPRGRKRKLSNAAQALDIGEQDDDLMNESGS